MHRGGPEGYEELGILESPGKLTVRAPLRKAGLLPAFLIYYSVFSSLAAHPPPLIILILSVSPLLIVITSVV